MLAVNSTDVTDGCNELSVSLSALIRYEYLMCLHHKSSYIQWHHEGEVQPWKTLSLCHQELWPVYFVEQHWWQNGIYCLQLQISISALAVQKNATWYYGNVLDQSPPNFLFITYQPNSWDIGISHTHTLLWMWDVHNGYSSSPVLLLCSVLQNVARWSKTLLITLHDDLYLGLDAHQMERMRKMEGEGQGRWESWAYK